MNSKVDVLWMPTSLALLLQFIFTSGKLSGDNICLTEEIYLVNVTEYYLRNVTVRNYQWCYNVPPRCSFYTTRNINDTRIVERNQTRTNENCCPGYTQIDDKCISSKCLRCENGVCEDGACICSSGFKGTTCKVACDIGEWGPSCLEKCDCNLTCDSLNGCIEDRKKSDHSAPESEDILSITTVTPNETIPSHSGTAGVAEETEEFVETSSEPFRETSTDSSSGPNMEPIREKLQEPERILDRHLSEEVEEIHSKFEEGYDIPVEIMFEDQVQHDSSLKTTTDQTTQETFTFVFRVETPYHYNANRSLLNTYLKLVIPIFALLVLVALILGIYYVSRMGDRKLMRNKGNKAPAVRMRSILDDPLPDPPTHETENTKYLTSCEYRTAKTIGAPTFETRIICNMEQKPSDRPASDCREFIYDHPRSSSHRASSPTDVTKIPATSRSEPVYDEIIIENPFLYIH
ncbi:unnamed protein product [Phaedon cochleariae]|uniref:EMI domain-containing protein n=1 Tax=Phaedon cochleariae TaxID=80249 RepID=A0A9P0GRR0_PHACE|nr:unnamed protein product [Phaedon cochleariae]